MGEATVLLRQCALPRRGHEHAASDIAAGAGQLVGRGVWPSWSPDGVGDMTGLDIQAPVCQREVTVLAPVAATLALIRLGHGLGQSSADITVACIYQACDVVSCGMPATIEATLTVFLAELVAPGGLKTCAKRA